MTSTPTERGNAFSRTSTTGGLSSAPGPGAPLSHNSTSKAEKPDPFGPLAQLTFVPAPTPTRRTSKAGSTTGGDGSSIKCEWSDDHKVVCFGDLMQKPVVRQWLVGGRLYREAEERAPSRFELFFDLLLVGVVHQLADTAAEQVSGLSVLKVVLTFYPAWSLWCDLRNFLNQSGVDDVAQRIHTLILMICVVGYSANASAIEVELPSEAAETAAHVVRRAVEGGAEAVAGHAGDVPWPQHAVTAAVTFFLVAKLARIFTLCQYAWALPDFRGAHLVRALGLIVTSLIFMGIIWAPTLLAAAILAGVGIAVDIFGRMLIGIVVMFERAQLKRREKLLKEHRAQFESGAVATEEPDSNKLNKHASRMIPALNIEHFIERNGGFVVVVLGESVVSLLYIASQGSYGASRQFGRATFALIVTFVFNATYFDAALSKRYVHAIRRHWSTNVMWDTLHFPLCASLILASAAVTKMVTLEETPRGVRWQYGGGLGVALFCITSAGLTHRSLDTKGDSRLNQFGRAIFRYCISLIFILIPLVNHITDTSFLATYAGVASAMVVFELWAKIGREPVDDEEDHTAVDAELENAREDEIRNELRNELKNEKRQTELED